MERNGLNPGLISGVNDMRRNLKYVYWLASLACFGYYFVLGMSSRFGLSLSMLWIAGGVVFALAGLACCTDRIPRWLRYGWRGMLCIGIAAILALECLVVSGMNSAAPQGLDYVIVLGARVDPDGPSPALRRRLNATLAYLAENPDTMVIASGGQGPDEPMSEAECIRRELVAAGIDESRILLEDRSTTTAENLEFSLALMEASDASAGVVTNNYHVYRAVKIAENTGLQNVHGLAAEYTGFTLPHYMLREAACLVVDFLRGNL